MIDNNLLSTPESLEFKSTNIRLDGAFHKKSVDVTQGNNLKITYSTSFSEIEQLDNTYNKIVASEPLNNIRFLNKFLQAVNYKLSSDGIFEGNFEEYKHRKLRVLNKKNKLLNHLIHSGDILVNRVLPKLKFSKRFYFEITNGKGRVLSKAEAFGRLYSCGFEIIEEYDLEGKTYFTAKKVKEPVFNNKPSYGPLIRLNRIGKEGKPIRVYKLRTMHPFSEYLQDYVYQNNDLQAGGKFKNDFRISKEGKIFRKFWLDELPMFINLLKGEMKIVGVRPLSEHYFRLYSEELKEKRVKTKPGLLPPFYADMPETLEEIIQSELKYLEAYEKAPFRTDIKYFYLVVKTIALKGARSK